MASLPPELVDSAVSRAVSAHPRPLQQRGGLGVALCELVVLSADPLAALGTAGVLPGPTAVADRVHVTVAAL